MKKVFLFFACTVLSATWLTAQLSQNAIQLPLGKSIYIGNPNNAAERLQIVSWGLSSGIQYGTYLIFSSSQNAGKSVIFSGENQTTQLYMGDNYDSNKRLHIAYIETASGGDTYFFNRGGSIYIDPKRTDTTNGISNNGKPVAEFHADGLSVRGSVFVSATIWSDFVFSENYRLPSLNEVKAHIDEHKTLPDIPSEAEVKEKGIDVAEMQAKLLQKIEELMLYTIQQQELIEKQDKTIKEQQKAVDLLIEKIIDIENLKK